MEPISVILSAAIGYILKAAAQSKAVQTAKEEVLEGYWNWIKKPFLEVVPDIAQKTDEPATQLKVQERLLELVKDENYFTELTQRVHALRQTGKNIVTANLTNVKRIMIGDKVFSPHETYKNIFNGSVNGADEFIVGDGH